MIEPISCEYSISERLLDDLSTVEKILSYASLYPPDSFVDRMIGDPYEKNGLYYIGLSYRNEYILRANEYCTTTFGPTGDRWFFSNSMFAIGFKNEADRNWFVIRWS